MFNLDWRSITPSNSHRFLVTGVELNAAYVPGTQSRFMIVETRTRAADGFPDTVYCVRDALTVSDDDVRNGIRAKVVFRGNLDAALEFVSHTGLTLAARDDN